MSQDHKNSISLESSGMDIPDYAIERMAKCLLPLMRTDFEGKEKQASKVAVEDERTNQRAAA